MLTPLFQKINPSKKSPIYTLNLKETIPRLKTIIFVDIDLFANNIFHTVCSFAFLHRGYLFKPIEKKTYNNTDTMPVKNINFYLLELSEVHHNSGG